MRNQLGLTPQLSLQVRSTAMTLASLALAFSPALMPSHVLAQQQAKSDSSASVQNTGRSGRADGARDREQLLESWAKLRGEIIEANELLSADVSNGLNPVGQVTDLVLSPDHRQVQYILYETPFPYSFWGAGDGFARYDGVDFEHGAIFDTTLRLEAEDSANAPEELALTRDQARERLVSRVIGRPMLFADDTSREIDDILIDRDTGAVVHYVIETDEDSIFRAQRRTVPAARVSIEDDGQVTAALRLGELADVQIYDPALL